MSKIALQKNWVFEPLNKIVVVNHMAPLTVNSVEGNAVNLEGILYVEEPFEEFNPEDYLDASYSEGILKLEFEEFESSSGRFPKDSQLQLKIPVGALLEIETDNHPLILTGLMNNLKVGSENAPVTISNCEGDKHVESENGPVRMHQSNGDLFIKLENGPLSAEAISGESVHIESENGPIKLRMACFSKVELETENGTIYYETQPVEDGDFTLGTENGMIHLILPLNFEFSLNASTETGRLKSNLEQPVTIEGNEYSIVSGNGNTKIKITTENGTIKLSNDGHLNLDFAKAKLEQLKAALLNAKTTEEKERVIELMQKVVDYVSRIVGSFTEENVKDKVNVAIGKLKDFGASFDFDETKDKVLINIEEIGTQIHEGLKDGLKELKTGFGNVKDHHFHKDVHEYIKKVMDSPLIKPYLGGDAKNREKDEIADRSRLKILEMLESGKITSEEAERLLKAIGKE